MVRALAETKPVKRIWGAENEKNIFSSSFITRLTASPLPPALPWSACWSFFTWFSESNGCLCSISKLRCIFQFRVINYNPKRFYIIPHSYSLLCIDFHSIFSTCGHKNLCIGWENVFSMPRHLAPSCSTQRPRPPPEKRALHTCNTHTHTSKQLSEGKRKVCEY